MTHFIPPLSPFRTVPLHLCSPFAPQVLIRTLPRQIRFCAKDSLWQMPIINWFIRASGGVPVYRPSDHGADAAIFNKQM